MVCGGRTGGHIYPILAVANELNSTVPSLELGWLGSGGRLEQRILAAYDIPRFQIAAGGVRGLAPWRALGNIFRLAWGTVQAYGAVRAFGAQVMFATGGFGAIPAVLGARLAGTRTLLYLPDIEPGLAVRAMGRLVDRVAVSFPEVRQRWQIDNMVVTGYPVRKKISILDRLGARRELGLETERKLVLVLGGSQGAHSINVAMGQVLEELLERYQILHITGPGDISWLAERRSELPEKARRHYHLHTYFHREMPQALAAADLALARAGAAVLGEFPAAGLPSILVPYPHAGAHQQVNAEFMVERGAALMIEDDCLSSGGLLVTLIYLLEDDSAREKLADASRKLAQPRAAARLAHELVKLAQVTATG
jgi:UDP-N-acetylglucosamine--N-acetylmuramyl-(pentapeptide) pyrophosphoryl-undecaprenol N-acetylglucosamine transferase